MSSQHTDRPSGRSVATLLGELEQVQRALAEGLSAALSEDGASVDRWRILELLDRPDGVAMGELASQTALPSPTVTRLVDALEDDASVFRVPDPADRRRITVRLTEQGRTRLTLLRELVAEWEKSGMPALAPRFDSLSATLLSHLGHRSTREPR